MLLQGNASQERNIQEDTICDKVKGSVEMIITEQNIDKVNHMLWGGT